MRPPVGAPALELKELKINRQPKAARRRSNPWAAKLLALAVLAAPAAASNMCDSASDFNGAVDTPFVSGSCHSVDAVFLGKLDKSSWNDVTCEAMASTVYDSPPEGNRSVMHFLSSVGPDCCSSLAKTRCFDAVCETRTGRNQGGKSDWSPPRGEVA